MSSPKERAIICLCVTDGEFSSHDFNQQLQALQSRLGNISALRVSSPVGAGEYQDLIKLIDDGDVAAVVVRDLSHLGDYGISIEEFIRFIARLFDRDVRFISIEDGIDTATATMGDLLAASIRAVENARKQVRGSKIRRGLLVAKAAGAHIGRPQKADTLAIRGLREKGMSLGEISRTLDISKGAVQYSLRHHRPKEG